MRMHSNAFKRWLRTTTTLEVGAKSCFKKAAYTTMAQAETVKSKCEARDGRYPLRIYRCEICGFLHLTKSTRTTHERTHP